MTLNIVVPLGTVYFVFIDNHGASRHEVVGFERFVRITVPPGIWFGFKGLFPPHSLLMNIADTPHDPTEIERKGLGEIVFDWDLAQ